MTKTFASAAELIRESNPDIPAYCIYPEAYAESTRYFLQNFPGRTLFAVKANNHPEVVQTLYASGVRHFDCASLAEVELAYRCCPGSTLYFMNPVRLAGHARRAQQDFGVRHFVIDHHSGLKPLTDEIDAGQAVIFARMAVSHPSAAADLSAKFGARPENVPALLAAIRDAGAEPALAFNVGSGVTDPTAYSYAMGIAREVLDRTPFRIRLLDIGGGFPKPYPGYTVPALGEFFAATRDAAESLPLANDGELLSEPGRALAAPGLSAITRVLLRKTDRIYLNDGMYGAFWELRFKAHLGYPCRVFRNGAPLDGNEKEFRIFGPTCDSTDELPAPVLLPEAIDIGDHIEFGSIGAYSLSGRTDFNGFYSEEVVSIVGSSPPT